MNATVKDYLAIEQDIKAIDNKRDYKLKASSELQEDIKEYIANILGKNHKVIRIQRVSDKSRYKHKYEYLFLVELSWNDPISEFRFKGLKKYLGFKYYSIEKTYRNTIKIYFYNQMEVL